MTTKEIIHGVSKIEATQQSDCQQSAELLASAGESVAFVSQNSLFRTVK